jgi:hypothetical protein
MIAAYARVGATAPTFVWVASPATALLAVLVLRHGRASLGASLRASLRASLGDCWHYAGQEAGWIAFYGFGREIGVHYSPKNLDSLLLHEELAQSCGWVWAYQNICIISERPERVLWDNAPRPLLHCGDGPAVRFRDGWEVYAWHGLRVEREIIAEPVNPDTVMAQRNVELRRILLERYGLKRFIAERGRLVHEDWTGRLYELAHPEGVAQRIAVVVNGTAGPDGVRKEYALSVPPDVKTCREAVAATYPHLDGSQRDPGQYHLANGRT